MCCHQATRDRGLQRGAVEFFKVDGSSLLAKRLSHVGKSFIPDKVVVEEVDEYEFFVLFKRDQAGLNHP